MGNKKWQKHVKFKNLKIPQNGQISGFEIFKFFCHLWFPIKKKFSFSKQTYFSRTKTLLSRYDQSRRRYIIKGKFSHFRVKNKCSHFTPEKTPPPFTLKSYSTRIYTIIAPPLRLKICWFSQGGQLLRIPEKVKNDNLKIVKNF